MYHILYCTLAFLLVIPQVLCTVAYVGPNADGNCFTTLCSLEQAAAVATQPNDAIVLFAGSYYFDEGVTFSDGVNITSIDGNPSSAILTCNSPTFTLFSISDGILTGVTIQNCLVGVSSQNSTIASCTITNSAKCAISGESQSQFVNVFDTKIIVAASGIIGQSGPSEGLVLKNVDFQNITDFAIDATDWNVQVSASNFSNVNNSFIYAAVVTLNGVTMTNQAGSMVGIPIEAGALSIVNSAFYGIAASHAILSAITGLTILNSRFENCSGVYGGIVYSPTGCPVNIDSCTFINNYALEGGAIYLAGFDVDISVTNNYFENNTAGQSGGAISIYSGNPSILYNTFISNSASVFGGAIATSQNNQYIGATIQNNNFTYNTAAQAGAIFMGLTVNVGIQFNTFVKNSASQIAGAILILAQGTGAYVAQNLFDSNSAVTAGGALYFQAGALVDVFSCTIIRNTVETSYAGSGIYIEDPYGSSLTTVTVKNTTLSNEAPIEFCCDGNSYIYTNVSARVCTYPACRHSACPTVPTGSCLCDYNDLTCGGSCGTGWEGVFCDTDIDECAQSNNTICGPHQTCTNTRGSYGCGCQTGYFGPECLTYCDATTTCHGNGSCGPNGECECHTGWTGTYCEVPCLICNPLICLCLAL